MHALFAPVAQLDRVLVSEAKGRGFDSRRAHQTDTEVATLFVRGANLVQKTALCSKYYLVIRNIIFIFCC